MRWSKSTPIARACAAGIVAVLMQGSIARAQRPQADSEPRRATLYKEGVTLADTGRWAEAVDRFRQVVAIRSSPPALFTLGQAEEKLGRLATAERTYERALNDARASGNGQVAEASVRAISALTPRIPRLIARLDPAGASVDSNGVTATVDGTPIQINAPAKLDPGDHSLSARAAGMRPLQKDITLFEARTTEIKLAFVVDPDAARLPPTASVSAPPAESAETKPPPREFPIGPTVVAATGLVIGIVGLAVRSNGSSDYDDASANCPGGACPTQALVDQANGGRTRMMIGTSMLVLGVAAMGGAGVWWALDSRRSSTPAAAFQVTPTLRGAAASIIGRF